MLTRLEWKEVKVGLMSAKTNKACGTDGLTAELIRAAIPWFVTWFYILWSWMTYSCHVAQTWKGGLLITLYKKTDPSKALNYR